MEEDKTYWHELDVNLDVPSIGYYETSWKDLIRHFWDIVVKKDQKVVAIEMKVLYKGKISFQEVEARVIDNAT